MKHSRKWCIHFNRKRLTFLREITVIAFFLNKLNLNHFWNKRNLHRYSGIDFFFDQLFKSVREQHIATLNLAAYNIPPSTDHVTGLTKHEHSYLIRIFLNSGKIKSSLFFIFENRIISRHNTVEWLVIEFIYFIIKDFGWLLKFYVRPSSSINVIPTYLAHHVCYFLYYVLVSIRIFFL